MPLPEKLLSVPPETVISLRLKFVDASESVKVRVAVSPTVKLLSLVVIAMVGGVVSATTVFTVMVTVLSASLPSALALLAASVKVLLATETTPLVVLLAVGVKVAV